MDSMDILVYAVVLVTAVQILGLAGIQDWIAERLDAPKRVTELEKRITALEAQLNKHTDVDE